jgi:hypothetical protein
MNNAEAKALALVTVKKIAAKDAEEVLERTKMRQTMLSDVEAEEMISSFARARGTRGVTEDEIVALLNESVGLKFLVTCIDLAAKGMMNVDIDMTQPPTDRLVFAPRKDISGAIRDVIAAKKLQNERAKSEP